MEVYLVIAVVAYFLGSIPTGYLLAQSFGKEDISKKGSKNIGATNAYRVAGKRIGIATLVADLAKGALAIHMVKFMKVDAEQLATLIAGFCVILGHIFPIWLKFRGGKGVATSLAVLFMIKPMLGMVAFSSFVLVYMFFRIVSVASLIAALTSALWASFTLDGEVSSMVIAVALLIFLRHRDNITRILDGKEKRL